MKLVLGLGDICLHCFMQNLFRSNLPNLFKIRRVLRKLWQNTFWCVFYAPQCTNCHLWLCHGAEVTGLPDKWQGREFDWQLSCCTIKTRHSLPRIKQYNVIPVNIVSHWLHNAFSFWRKQADIMLQFVGTVDVVVETFIVIRMPCIWRCHWLKWFALQPD